jgi:hypothetical protein
VSDCNNPNCQEAADRAVKKVFAILGVGDIIDPGSVPTGANLLQYADSLVCGK